MAKKPVDKNTVSGYMAKRNIHDNENGLVIPYGTYIATDNEQWVARMGKCIVDVNRIPSDIEPMEIGETVESKKAVADVEEEEESTDDTEATVPTKRKPPVKKSSD